jgi:hypothetical protein
MMEALGCRMQSSTDEKHHTPRQLLNRNVPIPWLPSVPFYCSKTVGQVLRIPGDQGKASVSNLRQAVMWQSRKDVLP